jgi:hypothetical protein
MASVFGRWSAAAAAAASLAAGCARPPEPVVPMAIAEAPAPVRPDVPAPSGADGRFTKLAPRVGDRHEQSSATSVTLSIDAGSPAIGNGGRLELTQNDEVTFALEVLATEGGTTTRASVTVVRAEKTTSHGGLKGTPTPSPIHGKTYVLSLVKGAVEVNDPDGTSAPGDEAREVREHFRSFGEPDALTQSLPSEPVRPGTPVPAVARALAHLAGKGSNMTEVTSSDATFRGTAGDAGIFDVVLTLGGAQAPLGISAELRGEVHVSQRTGAATHVALSGPVTIAGDGSALRGGGTISVVADARRLP